MAIPERVEECCKFLSCVCPRPREGKCEQAEYRAEQKKQAEQTRPEEPESRRGFENQAVQNFGLQASWKFVEAAKRETLCR